MTTEEYNVLVYLSHGWCKDSIAKATGLSKNQITHIMQKHKRTTKKQTKSIEAKHKRQKYVDENFVTRNDKDLKSCPFFCITVHKKLKTTNKNVYSFTIQSKNKKIKKASTDIDLILKIRNNHLRQNNMKKFKQLKKAEFKWFIRHPFNKFVINYIKQLMFAKN